MLRFSILPILLLVQAVHGQQSVTLNNVIIRFLNRGDTTDYFLISNLAAGIKPESAWLAIGLNSKSQMVNLNHCYDNLSIIFGYFLFYLGWGKCCVL